MLITKYIYDYGQNAIKLQLQKCKFLLLRMIETKMFRKN